MVTKASHSIDYATRALYTSQLVYCRDNEIDMHVLIIALIIFSQNNSHMTR